MTDSRITELVNGALDEELDDAARAEFDELMRSSDAARALYESLSDLDRRLRALPQAEVPDDLHETIVDAIDLPRSKTDVSARERHSLVPLSLAASAAVIVAASVYFTNFGDDPQNLEQMSGTIAPVVDNAAMQVDAPGLTSRARLERRGDATVLDITVESDEPVDLTIDLGDSGLVFDELTQDQSELDSFSASGQVLRARGRGRQKFAVLLSRDVPGSDTEATVRLAYSRDGALLKQGTLSVD